MMSYACRLSSFQETRPWKNEIATMSTLLVPLRTTPCRNRCSCADGLVLAVSSGIDGSTHKVNIELTAPTMKLPSGTQCVKFCLEKPYQQMILFSKNSSTTRWWLGFLPSIQRGKSNQLCCRYIVLENCLQNATVVTFLIKKVNYFVAVYISDFVRGHALFNKCNNIVVITFQVGAPNGYAFVFHVPSSVPQKIKDLLADPNIFCIQSSAFSDKLMLNEVSTVLPSLNL